MFNFGINSKTTKGCRPMSFLTATPSNKEMSVMAKKIIPFINSEGQLVKRCTKCDSILPVTEEYFYMGSRGTLTPSCKKCHNIDVKMRRASGEGREKYREYQKMWKAKDRAIDPTRQRKCEKDYRDRNANEISERRKKKWKLPENEPMREKNKLRLKENRERYQKNERDRIALNPGLRREKQREWWRNNNTPKRRLRNSMSGMMWFALKEKKGGRTWEALVDYTLDDLMRHLEKQFQQGMSWDNYGKTGWHIDHLIPVSAFNFKTYDDIDFKRAWALSNLQPMWAKENMSKGAKIDKPFQPSFAFGRRL
jgi:hypothetical protein